MAIITVYQGASGSGEELANAVAETLGCECISREVLIEASQIGHETLIGIAFGHEGEPSMRSV